MKKTLSALLLSLPLSVLAADLKLEDMKGQYVSLDHKKDCLEKIVLEVFNNRLMVYDLASGSHVLNREILNEKVKFSGIQVEGEIQGSTLIEKRYNLKKALGLVVSKELVTEIKVTYGQDAIQIEQNGKACDFVRDLPELVQEPQAPIAPEPTVEIGDITERANTDYVSIKRYFKDANELLDVDHASEVLKRLNKIKSATDKYHDDLMDLIGKKEELTVAEAALALKLPYFSAKDLKDIKAKIKEVSEAKPVDQKLMSILTQNMYTGQTFGMIYQSRLADLIQKKIKEVSVDEAKSIIKLLFIDNAEGVSQILTGKIKDISLEDKRSLIPTLEGVEAFSLASGFAVEILKSERPNYSTDELLSNSLELKVETFELVVGSLGSKVSDASVDNFLKLAKIVKDRASLSTIAKSFLTGIPLTSASDVMIVDGKLTNGSYASDAYKDLFLLSAADQVNPLSEEDALAMLKLVAYDSNRSLLFNKLIGRITEDLSAQEFESLVKSLNNGYYASEQYRDASVIQYYNKVQETDSNANLRLLDLLGSHAGRKSLALGIWNRDTEKSVEKLLALASKVDNGYYASEDYRDQVLNEGIKSIKSLSVSEFNQFQNKLSSDGKRLAQLKINVEKLPALSVDDLSVLISNIQNGYYASENYKDQALLILLPKTSVTKQSEINFLLGKASTQETKRVIMAKGMKLTLSVADLSLLIAKEGDSILKLELIKGLAPKIAPLSAQDIVGLIKTVENGYYEAQSYKTQSLNFLLDYSKVSSIDDIKLLMQQRADAPSRVAIYKKLKGQLGAVVASNVLSAADLIENGYYAAEQYKDDLILTESKLMSSVTIDELLKLVDKVASSASDKTLIVQMAAKVPDLSDLNLALLLNKITNGYYASEQYRDDTALALAPLVKNLSTEGINVVIKTIGGQLMRKKVALVLLAKKESVTKEDVQSIAQNITNGYYASEAYQTQFLAEAANLIK